MSVSNVKFAWLNLLQKFLFTNSPNIAQDNWQKLYSKLASVHLIFGFRKSLVRLISERRQISRSASLFAFEAEKIDVILVRETANGRVGS